MAMSPGGKLRPNALAVLRLNTSSNFVACSTGRSAGFAPPHVVRPPLPSQWLARGLRRSRKTLAAIATTPTVMTNGSTGA
jgi:hypothetical protein